MSCTQDATNVIVRGVVPASPEEVFALLSDPARHVLLDGSGSVRGVRDGGVLTQVGQVFVMEMTRPEIGDYLTENTVTVLVANRAIAWTATRPGNPVPGFWWRWDLARTNGGTAVTHTYDWSQVSDPAVLARVSFPRITPQEMQSTVDRLGKAVLATG